MLRRRLRLLVRLRVVLVLGRLLVAVAVVVVAVVDGRGVGAAVAVVLVRLLLRPDGHGLRHGAVPRVGGSPVQHDGLPRGGSLGPWVSARGRWRGRGRDRDRGPGDGVGVPVVGRRVRGSLLLVAKQLLGGWGVREVAGVRPLVLLVVGVVGVVGEVGLGRRIPPLTPSPSPTLTLTPTSLRGVTGVLTTELGLGVTRVTFSGGRGASVVTVVGRRDGRGRGWRGRHLGVVLLLLLLLLLVVVAAVGGGGGGGAPVAVVVVLFLLVLRVDVVSPRPPPTSSSYPSSPSYVGGTPGVGVVLVAERGALPLLHLTLQRPLGANHPVLPDHLLHHPPHPLPPTTTTTTASHFLAPRGRAAVPLPLPLPLPRAPFLLHVLAGEEHDRGVLAVVVDPRELLLLLLPR